MKTLPPGYSKAACIGKGAFGEVHRALEDATGRWVALKSMPGGDSARAEASVLALGIRSLPALHAVFSARGADWIAMEYVHGISLRDVVEASMDLSDLEALASAVAGALADLHAAGRAHGDFKPENVIVESTSRVRLVDFGLSVEGREAIRGGTSGYAAPEAGSEWADPLRCDLWSLGVVLHELLTGSRPSAQEVAGDLVRLEAAAPRWRTVVSSLLRTDHNKRPANACHILSLLPECAWPAALGASIGGAADRKLASLLAREAERLVHRRRPREALRLLQESLDLDPDQTQSLLLLPRLRMEPPRRWPWVVAAAAAAIAAGTAFLVAGSGVRPERIGLPKDPDGSSDRIRTPHRTGGSGVPSLPLREESEPR